MIDFYLLGFYEGSHHEKHFNLRQPNNTEAAAGDIVL